MFCGLKGATRTPRRCRMRHKAATSVLLPESEVQPCTIREGVFMSVVMDYQGLHYSNPVRVVETR